MEDVLVVGGGPAGLGAAEAAARAGAEVLVLERRPQIGEPVHTSGATAVETMVRHGIPRELWHPLTRIRVVSAGAEAVFEYAVAPLCVIDVRAVYRHLAARAEAAGVRLVTGTRATGVLHEDGAVSGVRTGASRVRARVTIDASGYRAAISRAAGLHPGFTRFGVGAEVELLAPRVRQDEALLVVGSRYAPAGYAWVFPWGGSRVRVGTGVHHADVRDDPRDHLELLLAEAGSLGVDLDGAEETERHFGLVPAEAVPRRLVADGVLAVGDAGCQATLVVGEGIRIALDAGRLAGEAAARAVAAGRVDARALAPYERAFRRRFGRSLALGRRVNGRLARYADADWDAKVRLLDALPAALVPPLLQSDFSPRVVARVAVTPRLWRPAAKTALELVRY